MSCQSCHRLLLASLCLVEIGLLLPGRLIADSVAPQPRDCVLDIPAQPLASALLAFASQCGIQLVMAADSVAGLSSPGIHGSREPGSALQQILAGAPLSFRFLGDTTAVVASAGAAVRTAAPDRADVQWRLQRSASSAATLQDDSLKATTTVVVTGTRLRRETLDAPTPTITLHAADLLAAGKTNLADALIELPGINPGITPQNSQNLTSGGAGLNLLNLRGLGLERTLVLVNGRRQVGAARGMTAVDINTIPTAFIERVEIVTGGTAAIYGADSISGVVNVILKERHDGVHVDYQHGLSARGDAATQQVSLMAGSSFADAAGHWMLGVLHDRVDGVDALARGYASDGLNVIASAAARPRLEHHRDVRFNGYSHQGSFTLGGQRYVFLDDGSGIRPFDFGSTGDRFGQQSGGDGESFERYDTLRMPVERSGALVAGDYEIGSRARLFFEGRLVRTQTSSAWQPIIDPAPNDFLPLHIDNPYLPADVVELMRRSGADTLAVARIENEFGRGGSRNERRLTQLATGIDGTFGNDWQYQLFASFGHNHDGIVSTNTRDTVRFFQSVDAIRDAHSGEIVCRDAAARAQGCVALNVVGIDAASRAAVEYSRVDLAAGEEQRQRVVGGHIAGQTLSGPAGRIDAALGWEYRDEFSRRVSSALQAAGTAYLPRAPSGSGSYEVSEGFVELTARLFENAVPGESLTLGAAGRASDYSTVGTEWTWQGTANYRPANGVHLRAARSRSIRAPNIRELYFPGVEGFVEVADPCDALTRDGHANRAANCAALGLATDFDARNGVTRRIFFFFFGSNGDLRAEVADTVTAGMVLAPPFAAGWQLAVDFWRIDLEQAIVPLDAQEVLNRCVDLAAPLAANPFCGLVARTASGLIDVIRVREENAGRLRGAGVDLELLYGTDLPAHQALQLQLRATYLSQLRFSSDAGHGLDESLAGVLPNPRLVGQSRLEYRFGPLGLTWRTQYLGSSRIGLPLDIEIDRAHTGSELYHDLHFSWELTPYARLSLGIDNVLDNRPPRRGLHIKQGIGEGAIYPNLGTRFFAVLSVDF